MSEPVIAAVERRQPSGAAATRQLTGTFVGMLVTRARLLTLGALGVLVVLMGLVARAADDPVEIGSEVLANLGLGIVVPIATLVLATATLGELRSERTLVFVWLRPIPRWSIALAAMLATLIVALPLAVVPLGLSAAVSGEMSLVGPAALAAVIAVVGYTGVFVTLGAVLHRAFLVGLGYVLVWEGLIARAGGGFARLSVLAYASSVLEELADVELGGLGEQSLGLAIGVPVAILLVGCLLTARLLARREVD